MKMAEKNFSLARLNSSFPGTAIDRMIAEAVRRLDNSSVTDMQVNAIWEFVLVRDVFATLQTTNRSAKLGEGISEQGGGGGFNHSQLQ